MTVTEVSLETILSATQGMLDECNLNQHMENTSGERVLVLHALQNLLYVQKQQLMDLQSLQKLLQQVLPILHLEPLLEKGVGGVAQVQSRRIDKDWEQQESSRIMESPIMDSHLDAAAQEYIARHGSTSSQSVQITTPNIRVETLLKSADYDRVLHSTVSILAQVVDQLSSILPKESLK